MLQVKSRKGVELVVGVLPMIVGFVSPDKTIFGLEVLVRKSDAVYKGSILSYKEVHTQSQPLVHRYTVNLNHLYTAASN